MSVLRSQLSLFEIDIFLKPSVKKECHVCHQILALDQFEAFRKKKSVGYRNRCKDCASAYRAQWYANRPADEKQAAAVRAAERYRAKDPEERLAYSRDYQERNRARIKEKRAAYYAANVEKICAKIAEYRKNNWEAIAERAAAWQRNNKEKVFVRNSKWKRKNPDKVRAQGRRRYAANPARGIAMTIKRRAAKRTSQVESFTVRDVIARDGSDCYICGVVTSTAPDTPFALRAEIDHVIPLAKGGPHTMENARCACTRCNRVKNAYRTPEETRAHIERFWT